ncbi:MAG: DNA/RNA non-specific endonuclease [Clostridiaceae bacterium]
MKKLTRSVLSVLIISCLAFGTWYFNNQQSVNYDGVKSYESVSMEAIPNYIGDAYVAIDNNNPSFNKDELSTTSFESYSDLDEFDRCGVAYANIGIDLMPTDERGDIGSIKPTGWQTIKYDNVSGKYLYNRCHLIGYQLTAENANEENLITGTRYLNIDGMLPFENMVADYVKETKNHVLYRVTPVFEGNNLVASGVLMEGYSVEDNGEGISFNVYVYNVQPEITIDYLSGESRLSDTEQVVNSIEDTGVEIRGNSNSKIYHCLGQAAYEEMSDSKNLVIFHSEQEAIDVGYRKAKR